MSDFVPGIELSRRYYAEVVLPYLQRAHPGLPHSAALIGAGSEVLGFDTERSRDHDWGPRLQLFVTADAGPVRAGIDAALPEEFAGYPTRFPRTGDEVVRHRVEIGRFEDWLGGKLLFDPRAPITTLDWLSTPSQRFAELTAGEVFHDDLGLCDIRERLAWYPDDVWRFILMCQWARIAQEIPFAGRCAEVGDELGSAVLAARMVRDLMRLHLLMERRYPPYSKWLGSAFSRTEAATVLEPVLRGALAATAWTEREDFLSQAYEFTGKRHNELGLTPPQDTQLRYFHERPFRIIDTDSFVAALRDSISDPQLRAARPVGAVDNFIDSTDAIGDLELLRAAVQAQFG